MSKLFKGSINFSELERLVKNAHSCVYNSKNGVTYINVNGWLNDEPDKFGNILSVQASTKKDEARIYVGNFSNNKSDANGMQKQTNSIETPF